jgi:hypothetical protein
VEPTPFLFQFATPRGVYILEKLYVYKFLIYLDRFVGACIFRESNITISAQCGLELRKPAPAWWARWLGDKFLNRFWPGHCEIAIRYDAYFAQRTIDYLNGKIK